MQNFVIYYRRGAAWVDGRSVFEQPLQEHLAYMKSLNERNILILGGPFTDDAGGMIIVKATALEEANELFAKDPAVRTGVMTAEAHPWKVLAGERLLNSLST